MKLKFMEPQSRFVAERMLKRKFDGMTDGAQVNFNRLMLVGDVLLAFVVLSWIF